jgi:hypothetical protein
MKVLPRLNVPKFLLLALAVLSTAAVPAFAKGGSVSYNPLVQVVEGNMPFSSTYVLAVTAPADFPVGGSANVGFRVDATTVPVGTAADALSYVTFFPSTLNFTAPGQTLNVNVTVNFPEIPLAAGATSATFSYQVYTTGWPTTPSDAGTAINATVSLAPAPASLPTVTITSPADGAVLTYGTTGLPAQVPFHFDAASTASSPITAVDAMFGGAPVNLTTVTGLGTANVSADGFLTVTTTGAYSVCARATNSAGVAMDTNGFTVSVSAPAPTVVIDTPANGSVYTYHAGAPALSVPVHFTATSVFGGIRTLTATVDNAAATFVPDGIGALTATGTVNLSYTTAGIHTVVVTTTDDNGTATAQTSFTIKVEGASGGSNSVVSGTIFFDVDCDGTFDAVEFGIAGIPVELRSTSGAVLASTTSAADGTYSFSNVAAGTYVVHGSAFVGLVGTHGSNRTITVNSNVADVNIGYMLNFVALAFMKADGCTIGYWKNNLDKAISGAKSGMQVSAAALAAYTGSIGSLALAPYDNITMKQAVAIMSSTSSKPADLLSKQLLAAEYNYENGAYINGNRTLTFLFIWWGEYILGNASHLPNAYVLWAKDCFDAYNNSHGGWLLGGFCDGASWSGSSSCDNNDDHRDGRDCRDGRDDDRDGRDCRDGRDDRNGRDDRDNRRSDSDCRGH